MIGNLEQLRRKRRKWVDANRENNFEEGIKRVLSDLYPDKAHFIFELLQNAEDAHATEVRFILRPDRLEFEHNGSCLFSLKDVDAITSFGVSTKRDDPTNIGKFGIGFKAVFAYTNTPEIHSGEFHFRIRDLVVPETYGVEIHVDGERRTLFVFPFDHPKKLPGDAVEEVDRGLYDLRDNTLLFLGSIRKIEYVFPDKSRWFLERTDHEGGRTEICASGPGHKKSVSHWMRFQKDCDVTDEEGKPKGKPKTCRVAIAYSLVEGKTSDGPRWRIRPIDQGQVSIYFPAEKEISRLHFHVHAPFASTVARDSVRDCKANHQLLQHLAELLVNSLDHIHERGMLTVQVLESLPIVPNDFPCSNMYRPMFERTKEALSSRALLPTNDGRYAAAHQVILTDTNSSKLRTLLNSEQLTALYGSKENLLWLSDDITEKKTPQLWRYLTDTLRIAEVDAERFAALLSEEFLHEQPHEWFADFYEFLLDHEVLWRTPRGFSVGGILRTKPILLLEDGSRVEPFDAYDHPNAYLPPKRPVTFPVSRLHVISRKITGNRLALHFLERLGLVEPDEVDYVIQEILPKYLDNGQRQIDDKAYREDLKAISRALRSTSPKKTELAVKVRKTHFVRAVNAATKHIAFRTPAEVYLPTPDMQIYLAGNPSAWLADELFHKEHRQDAKLLGLAAKVRVICREWCVDDRTVEVYSGRGRYIRGLHRFDPDAEIDQLEFALSNPNLERSRFVWNKVLIPQRHLLRGTIEISTRQNYGSSRIEETLSVTGKLVLEHAWITGRDGVFSMPGQIALADLPDGFERDEDLARDLGMNLPHIQDDQDHQDDDDNQDHQDHQDDDDNQDYLDRLHDIEMKKFARALCVEPENLQMAVNNPEEFARWCEEMNQRSTLGSSFPVKDVLDPERREERLLAHMDDAPEKEYKVKDRSVRTTKRKKEAEVWLRNQYTNDAERMFCQICQKEMPFRKRNGEYYFEAVEAFPLDTFAKEHQEQYLALCPLCAAMYHEFVRYDKKAMNTFKKELMNWVVNSCPVVVPLQLGKHKTSIQFVETHFHDIKTIIKHGHS